MRRAIYPLTADPVTFGHLDIINRASKMFDQLIVALGRNIDKKPLFTLAERIYHLKNNIKQKNVSVVSFEGLLPDFATQNKISHIIRGVRDESDFTYEKLLYQISLSLNKEIDFVLLPANPNSSHISSGAAKAIIAEQGDLSNYTPIDVIQSLQVKLLNQYIIGVTGTIGAGKSYFCKQFKAKFEDKIPIHHIDVDGIARDYIKDELLTSRSVHYEILNKVKLQNLDMENFKSQVLKHPKLLQKINQELLQPICNKIRTCLLGKQGIILIESAMLTELKKLRIVNNQIIFISSESDFQNKNIVQRKVSIELLEMVGKVQFNQEKKLSKINRQIVKANFGKIYKLNNPFLDNDLNLLFFSISSKMNALKIQNN